MMMKKSTMLLASVLAFGMAQSAIANPNQLAGFNRLVNSLINGNVVRVTVNLDQCTSSSSMKKNSANTIAGLTINEFMISNAASEGSNSSTTTVDATDTILVNSSQYGYVNNRFSMHFTSDGLVSVVSELIDPKAFTVLSTNTYSCNLSGQGKANVSAFELT